MTAGGQLILDLAQRPALGADDFLISGSNRAAASMVDRWPDWPHASTLVVAPARAGKTHLANVWRLKSAGEATLLASTLDEATVTLFQRSKALVIEDLDRGIGHERVLFHLLNLAREHKTHLLLTSARLPGDLDVELPDLRSRLRALPVIGIENPDADLLRSVPATDHAAVRLLSAPKF